MSDLYSGLAKPSGKFASQLERKWDHKFKSWGWNAEYIGDKCNEADFEVSGVLIEIKPDGEKFVQQAAFRSGNILVIEGSPGRCRWWFVDDTYTATLIANYEKWIGVLVPDGPRVVWGGSIGTARMETIEEFMSRHKLRFK